MPRVNTVPIGSTSYCDTGLAAGVSHSYTVTAIDAAANESGASNTWSGAASSGAVTTTYSYDAENRLTGLASDSNVIGTYAYDGAGNRYSKTAAGVTTAYTLDLASGLPQVLTETAGSAVSSYAYAGGPLELDKAGTTYWYLTDTLGSVRLLTDATGATPATYAYSAFGSTRASTGTLANEVRFTGERTDTESGLEFLQARTYDPATGTFLQRDSWGISPTDGQSIDAYVYTSNNPINAVDPSGRCTYGGYGGTCSPQQYVGDTSTCAGHDCSPAQGAPVNTHTCQGHDCPSAPKADSAPKWAAGVDPAGVALTVLSAPLSFGGDTWSHTFGGLTNHPADFLHDRGLSFSATIGLCAGGDASGSLIGNLGIQGSAGGCAYATTNGQIGLGYYYGGGGGVGTKGGHAGGDFNVLLSNGGDISDQEGPFGTSGGQVSDGLAGADINGAIGSKHCGTGGIANVSGGWSPGFGASTNVGIGTSKTVIVWQSKPSAACPGK